MKIIFIADIHSNFSALKACLDYADECKPDGVVFLGDYITDCPYPQRTIKLLKECSNKYKTWFVRGNREDYIINHHKNKQDNWSYSSRSGSFLYTYENLTEKDIEFFSSMPICREICIEGYPAFTACHATPIKSKDNIYGNYDKMRDCLHSAKTDILICGHMHRCGEFEVDGKKVIFVGSAGLPRYEMTGACIMVMNYEGSNWKVSYKDIQYDKKEIISAFEESGIYNKGLIYSRCVAYDIKNCTDTNLRCVRRVEKRLKEVNDIDFAQEELFWLEAAKEENVI